MMMFVRAEREADWPLHLEAYRQMIPYFFAAGHVHYPRYGICYLRSMGLLPKSVLSKVLNGEHVMRHEKGIWNGIWSDMFIESTFMRYGHAPCGIIGITLKPETLKVWALSLHTCSQLESDLDDMIDYDNIADQSVMRHKEEGKLRIENDAKDRKGISSKLETCIDPLDPSKITDGAVLNIVTGEMSTSRVNVYNAVQFGTKQITGFECKLPGGLHETIHKKVITMSITKTHIKIL